MKTPDNFYPDRGYHVDSFTILGWKIAGMTRYWIGNLRYWFSVRFLWPLSHGHPFVVLTKSTRLASPKSSYSGNIFHLERLNLPLTYFKLVMGRVKNFWPGSGPVNFFCSGWVRQMVWVWIWKISPKNIKVFNFFPFRSKKISLGRVEKYLGRKGRQPLIYCGSKVSSGRVRAHLYFK